MTLIFFMQHSVENLAVIPDPQVSDFEQKDPQNDEKLNL